MSRCAFAVRLSARSLSVAALLLAAMSVHSQAQTTSATDGTTPASIAAGAPAGSYSLSGFDNVNLYSGDLNFQMPLLGIEGRGGARMTVMLRIDSEHWRVEKDVSDGPGYSVTPNTWEGIRPGYGPGVLQGRRSCFISPTTNRCTRALTRLTFTAPDGTEYELHDQLYGGQPRGAGTSLGTTFVSADGTASTFVSDTVIVNSSTVSDVIYPSGYLMLADGTRYRIDSGVVTWLRDRNGNKLSFIYDAYSRVTTITDSLNRKVTVSYADLSTIFYDQITYNGFGGASRTIKVWHAHLDQALRASYAIETYGQLFGGNGGGLTYDPNDMVSALDLPDGRRYQFLYNSYGELARVVLPTGGAVEYDYTPDTGYLTDGADYQIYRRLTERRVYPDGTNLEGKQVYSFACSAPGSVKPWYSTATVEHRSPSGALLAADKHYFYGSPVATLFQYNDPTNYPTWQEGREYQTESLDTDGTTVLRRTADTWQQRATVEWWAGSADDAPANDPRISQSVKTVEPAGANLISQETYAYDDTVPYNNRTDVYEYDYGTTPGQVGALLRHAHTDYVTSSAYTGTDVHLRRLAGQQWISSDLAGTSKKSLIVFEYDNYAADSLHAALIARPGISGLDSAFSASYTTRGNVTLLTKYADASGATGAVKTAAQYDVAGNVIKTVDARGYATTFSFTDCFGAPDGEARTNSAPVELSSPQQTAFAFATSVTNALGHTSYGQYDYYTGKPVDGEDINGVVTSGYYNDPLDRATQVVRAVGTSAQSQTSFAYDYVNHLVTVTGDLTAFSDNLLKSQTLYDGLGRTTETRQYETATTYITTKAAYDALGRKYRVSNPYRDGDTVYWTTTQFDALGRATSITTPDNAVVSTVYAGTLMTVTDAMNRSRSRVTDALGRLIQVVEDPAPGGLHYVTDYTYDALGNLRAVSQGSQRRYFKYDSLSRLVRAKNPEQAANAAFAVTDPETGNSQWSLSYSYDANGNLLTKTDARGVSVTYNYDALNRNTTIDYSDTEVNPDVTRGYDGAALGKGRFWYSYAGGNETTGSTVEKRITDSYDASGRPLVQRQLFKTAAAWGASYQSQRAYNLAGGVTSEIYPSGHTVSYLYDRAGRPSDFRGTLGDGASRLYSTGAQYAAAGLLTQEQFGTDTPVYNKSIYNVRQQLTEIRVGTTANDTGWQRGAIINHYSNQSWAGSGSDNNGRIKRQEVYIPNFDGPGYDQGGNFALITQSFTYDSVNRLLSAGEAGAWTQSYTYDCYGNRTMNTSGTVNAPAPQFTADASSNRLSAPAGFTLNYDAAGQLTFDNYTGSGTRTYDAEGRITAAQIDASQSATYTYDADGRRVRRNTGSGEVWQVYGPSGELMAEYAAGASAAQPQKEYGYRAGQLLITATAATAGWGAPPVFDDNPLNPHHPGETPVRAIHLTQLRAAINSLRSHLGLPAYSWQSSAAVGALIKADPIVEMRAALDQALGAPAAGYSAGLAQGQPVKAIHIQELRERVLNAWQGGPASTDVRWLITDQLGTPRMVLDHTGTLTGVTRHDYLPFGEELHIGASGRTAQQGYVADTMRQKFTGYEQDAETGLDFAQARYVSTSQGRFTSPDPFAGSMRAADPQSLNRYSYTGNEPLNRTDPTGTFDATDQVVSNRWVASQEFDVASERNIGADHSHDFDASPVDPLPDEDNKADGAAQNEVSDGAADAAAESSEPAEQAVAVIIVSQPGLDGHNVGNNFMRAAETRKTELEKLHYHVLLSLAASVDDFNAALHSYTSISLVEYFGHAGPGGLFIGENAGEGTNLTASTISRISGENLTKGAQIILHGCNTAVRDTKSIAAQIAVRLNRTTVGFDGTLSFSGSPHYLTGSTPPRTGPLYLIPDAGVKMVGYEP